MSTTAPGRAGGTARARRGDPRERDEQRRGHGQVGQRRCRTREPRTAARPPRSRSGDDPTADPASHRASAAEASRSRTAGAAARRCVRRCLGGAHAVLPKIAQEGNRPADRRARRAAGRRCRDREARWLRRLDSLRRHDPDQVRGSAVARTLSAPGAPLSPSRRYTRARRPAPHACDARAHSADTRPVTRVPGAARAGRGGGSRRGGARARGGDDSRGGSAWLRILREPRDGPSGAAGPGWWPCSSWSGSSRPAGRCWCPLLRWVLSLV